MPRTVALLALAAAASAAVTGPVTMPCGTDGAYPAVAGSGGPSRALVRGDTSAKCFVDGVAWDVPETAVDGAVIRDVRVEGGIHVVSAATEAKLLLEGLVIACSVECVQIWIGPVQLTVRSSVVERTATNDGRHKGFVINSQHRAANILIVDSTVTTKVVGGACGFICAVRNPEAGGVVVVANSTIEVRADQCKSGEAVAINAANVTIKNSQVTAVGPSKAMVAWLRTGGVRIGWLVVEGSHLTATGTAAGATVTGVEAIGMRLASSTITVNGTAGNVTAARVVPSGAAALPVTVQASTLSATAAGGEATGLLWSGDLATRLDLGVGTNVSGPVIVEGDVTGGIAMNGAAVTAADGPALDVRGAVSGTLEFGVTAAASLVTPTMPPVNVMRFAEPCSVTFGAYPADVAALEPLLIRTAGVCKATMVTKVPETEANGPVSSAASLPLSVMFFAVLATAAAAFCA